MLSSGPVKGLTILVNFQDITSTVTRADVNDMLNGTNYTRNGNICSAREYFQKVSSGRLDYTNVVVGPYTLSRNRQFYVNTLLIEEALNLAVADGLDLTQFDSRHENVIDALNVLYAGQTQYNGELWPHNFHIDLQFGNIKTDLYLLTSLGRSAADLSIGTFCHENGHLLCRFPDMYDYGQRDGDNIPSAGIGMYCLMGAGNHLDSGRSPSPVCSYLRDLVGWCDNQIDLTTAGTYEAKHGDYDTVIKYPSSKPNEYFIVENRSKMDLDRGLPASGLAIYHCDILGSNERQQGTAANHYQCALLQADGRRDLEMNVNQGDGSDLFGVIGGVAVSADSATNSREWDGRDSGLVDHRHLGPGRGDHLWRRRERTVAERGRDRQPDAPDSRRRSDWHRQRDRDRGIRHGLADSSGRADRAHLHRRSAGHAGIADGPPCGAARTARRVDRQSDRDLRFGDAGRAREPRRAADAGQLGAQRRGPRRAGCRCAAELAPRDRVGRRRRSAGDGRAAHGATRLQERSQVCAASKRHRRGTGVTTRSTSKSRAPSRVLCAMGRGGRPKQ